MDTDDEICDCTIVCNLCASVSIGGSVVFFVVESHFIFLPLIFLPSALFDRLIHRTSDFLVPDILVILRSYLITGILRSESVSNC
jgi:hypothetical protein